MAAHRQDVTDGQDMIVAQDPADRECWSGSMEEVMSFPSGSATTAPIDECRLPCGLCGPIELGLAGWATLTNKNGVDGATSRSSIQPTTSYCRTLQ